MNPVYDSSWEICLMINRTIADPSSIRGELARREDREGDGDLVFAKVSSSLFTLRRPTMTSGSPPCAKRGGAR